MPLEEFNKAVVNLRAALSNAKSLNIDLTKTKESKITDYEGKKEEYYRKAVFSCLDLLRSKASGLEQLMNFDEDNKIVIPKIRELVKEVMVADNKEELMTKIAELATKVKAPVKKEKKRPKLPEDIREDVYADLDEMEKCFEYGAYRSVAILCGRILETALHRKHFEVTNNDLLEKAPGIGLGKIVAKLSEKNIKLDPGLTQQIHLINQVRISSVHVKQQVFQPSRAQAEAMMLYTTDILEKIFKNDKA